MSRKFFFFVLSLPEETDIPPLYGETTSDIERHLKYHGAEIIKVREEFLKEGVFYRGNIYGIDYRYGYFVDGDMLVFLFTVPSALKFMESKPVKVQRKIIQRLPQGFLEREFYRLEGFQFAELISGHLYVGTEW